MPTAQQTSMERTARLLGLCGLIPIALLALWLCSIPADHVWREGTIMLLVGYSASVLSFLGGIRWGLAMLDAAAPAARELGIGALPPLIGWASLATPVPYSFAILAVAFAAQGAADTVAVHVGRGPSWYGRLRTLLTPAAVAAMILAFAATS